MILRTIKCICGKNEQEQADNQGFPGWGRLSGVVINNDPNPHLCPECLAKVAEFTDSIGG